MLARMTVYDYDWIVVGSGFGGSVCAHRLTEKGYSVAVVEAGKRYNDHDFPKSTWDLRRYFFAPRMGLHGIFRLSLFKDVSVVSGAGVGGGSLGYANTLYRPRPRFYNDPQWADLGDWERELAPHLDEAERMLGVATVATDDPADDLLREFGEHIGADETYAKTRVGVFFGEAGKTVPDPYFGGAGPARTGCIACGRCMVGCPVGAKNTLPKNYLWFAERAGAQVMPERTVIDVRPLARGDGSDGYAVTTERTGAWVRKQRRTLTARNVVLAGGALGTNRLLQRCRHFGSMPRISTRVGELVRTNSEAILAVTAPDDSIDFTKRVAISGSIYPATRAPGRGARSSCSSCRRSTTRSRCARARAPAARCACRPSRTPTGPTRRSSRSPTRLPSGWPSGSAASPRARRWRRSSASRRPPTSSAARSSATPSATASSTAATASSATRTCSSATARSSPPTSA